MEHRKSPSGMNLFTDISWDDHDHKTRGMSPDAVRRDSRLNYWMGQHDMEVQLAEGSDIPMEWARVLVPAALRGHPVTVTRRMGDMTVTETGTVTQFFGPVCRYFTFRTWGMCGPVYLDNVVTIHTPDTYTVLHTADGHKVLSDDDSRNAKVFRDGTEVTLKGTIDRYAAVSRVGTRSVPPAE
jgi:hypothetical protein